MECRGNDDRRRGGGTPGGTEEQGEGQGWTVHRDRLKGVLEGYLLAEGAQVAWKDQNPKFFGVPLSPTS